MRVLILLLLSLSGVVALAEKPEADCRPETLAVLDQDLKPHDVLYLKCILRGESARTTIRNFYAGTNYYAVNDGRRKTAWEFYGKEVACAARTQSEKDMDTIQLLLKNLAQAEALCLFYINPQTGIVEWPNLNVSESSAGVSNNF